MLTGGESGKPKRLLSAFSQRVPTHVPSPPSRWAGRYGPSNVRAAGRVSRKKYSLPPHNPTREGGPGGGTSSPGGSFPHFFPRNGAPAGQAKVPCRSNGWEAPTGTRVPTPGRLIFQGNKKVPYGITSEELANKDKVIVNVDQTTKKVTTGLAVGAVKKGDKVYVAIAMTKDMNLMK